MTRPKIFISHYMPQIGVDMLRQHADIDYYDGIVPLTKAEFIRRAADADAVVAFVCDYIDEDILEACPKLRIVSSFGKGYDNIDVEACTRRGIRVIINAEALTQSTADLAIGLLLGVSRNLMQGDRHVRARDFDGWHATRCLGRDFHHSRLGIIGMGAIGQAIARRAGGFEPERIAYCDIERKPAAEASLGVVYAGLDDLLRQSDYVIMAVDLREDNRYLLDAPQLALMQPHAYLINISRGSLVREEAVAEALREGRIQGYAADVFEFEDRMFPDRPAYIEPSLLAARGTLFTPHIGTGTAQARDELAVATASQLLQALRGDTPAGLVNGFPASRA